MEALTVRNQRDPAMKIEYSGAASGTGAKWSWQSKTEGTGSMEFTDAQAGNRLVYRLRFPEFGMESTGLLAIAPAGGGSKVTWTVDGDTGSSPFKRWFGVLMEPTAGPEFEAGLVNLKKLAESG